MIDGSSIGDLFSTYDVKLQELERAKQVERNAIAERHAIEAAISNLQKSIDNVIETRRKNPPFGTHWNNPKACGD